MKLIKDKLTWTSAIAIFSMFFGAGNVVFPLLLGKITGNKSLFATLGLLITSIGGPLLGLFGAILFRGNFKDFFCRIGLIPGYVFMVITALLLGPFAVMPRCIIVSYAALKPYIPFLTTLGFSIFSGIVVFLLVWKRNALLGILGNVLSPILIFCLLVVIIISLSSGSFTKVDIPTATAFTSGLLIGYDTMDLIASIFFAVSIWTLLRTRLKFNHEENPEYETKMVITSGSIAGVLLGLIYLGFCISAAKHINILEKVPPQSLLTALASATLGKYFGFIANIAIALACITTVMSLTVTFSEIIRRDFHIRNISHSKMVFILVFVTAVFSNLGFETIMKIIHPTVEIFYPAIIVMTLCNIGYKLFGFRMIKAPVFITLSITMIVKAFYFMH